jgi:hypothetical protein
MMEYVRRWAVQGSKPNGDRATTIFDLLEGRRHVMVYPATLDTFAVKIDGDAVRRLAEAARLHNACAVPALHAVHGTRQLGLRQYDTPPFLAAMELYVTLPGNEMRIVYWDERLHLLNDTFAHVVDWLL